MILVTGGTGLVGRHLLLELTSQGKEVKAIYRSESKVEDVKGFFAFAKADTHFSNIQWIPADITDIPSLTKAFKDVTHVYHCAGMISYDPYDFEKLIKINVEGTANIVNLCLANGIKKLCHLSSIATIGKLPNRPVTEENPWDPNDENSVYAISKFGAETEVWRGTQEGLKVIIFNPGVILGEGDYTQGSGLFFKRILDGSRYYPKGGTGFIDVKDVVKTMTNGLESSINNERFILISENKTYKEILSSIAYNLSKKSPTKELSATLLSIGYRLDALAGLLTRKRRLTKEGAILLQEVQSYDITKLKTELGFSPQPIEETIARIAKHIKKSNPS